MIDVADESRQDTKKEESTKDEDRPKDGYVFCADCSHVLAHVDDRIEVGGSHDHRFTNPHGYTHHFGCYRDALGCAIQGRPTPADSWFPGYHWQLAHCGNCQQHLGWLFEREDHFYGLILANIQTG